MQIRFEYPPEQAEIPPGEFDIIIRNPPEAIKWESLLPPLVEHRHGRLHEILLSEGRQNADELRFTVYDDLMDEHLRVDRRNWFMKNELLNTDPDSNDILQEQDDYKRQYGVDNLKLAIVLGILQDTLSRKLDTRDSALDILQQAFPDLENPAELIQRILPTPEIMIEIPAPSRDKQEKPFSAVRPGIREGYAMDDPKRSAELN